MPRPIVAFIVVFVTACGRIGIDPEEVVASSESPDAGAVVEDPYLASVLADHPIALWRFDDDGPLASPTFGHGQLDGVAELTTGLRGNGLAFDGRTTRIALSGFDAASSIELWVRPAVRDDHVRFLVEGATADAGLALYSRDQFTMAERDSAGVPSGYAKAPGLALDVFTHVVVTIDETHIDAFVDGVRYEGLLAPSVPGGGPLELVVGDTLAGSYFKFEGVVDDLALYEGALPADRVIAHHDATR